LMTDAPIHDFGRGSGIDFVVMEYPAGKMLDQLIPRKGMRLNETLKVAIQMADALAKAHSAGIVHRDPTWGESKIASFCKRALCPQRTLPTRISRRPRT
jgi:serine/threonine protein kinase